MPTTIGYRRGNDAGLQLRGRQPIMLPAATATGELPPGIHPAGWDEIEKRFGRGSEAMQEFLATWQMKRDGTLRGMSEVKP